jgi:hypothetical protein
MSSYLFIFEKIIQTTVANKIIKTVPYGGETHTDRTKSQYPSTPKIS